MGNKPEYANWIPKKMIISMMCMCGILVILLAVSFIPQTTIVWIILRIVLALMVVGMIGFASYMTYSRKLLSYNYDGIQGKILDNVLHYLEWDGQGQLLDIGCGSGAMSIKAAKKYPQAKIMGIDYWGPGWDYAKSQCERNAEIEGVAGRITFQKGDAAHLDFEDGIFDAAISNFVFHEVKTQPDKTALIKEALRVIKPGGTFSFGDVFFSKSNYPDLEEMIQELSKEVDEIHFVDTRKCDFVPKVLKTPFIAGDMGLIYGRK